jgi:hypothetical protein
MRARQATSEATVVKLSVVVLGYAVLAGALSGCSSAGPSGGPQLAVQGSVSQGVHVDNARAVAIGTDGRTFWAYLDAQRDFTLTLPVGQSYRVVIANGREGGGEAIVGHLVVPAASGASDWLGANEPGTVDLGTLQLQSESTLESEHPDHGDSDHSDDHPCHEGGHHGGGGGDGDGVCSEGNDDPLSPTKNPGSKCDDHDHHAGHPGHHGSHCDGGKGDDDGGGGDGDDPPCSHGDAGHAVDAGHGGDGGSSSDGGTGGGVGAECLTSADCAAHLSCIAGLCTATVAE